MASETATMAMATSPAETPASGMTPRYTSITWRDWVRRPSSVSLSLSRLDVPAGDDGGCDVQSRSVDVRQPGGRLGHSVCDELLRARRLEHQARLDDGGLARDTGDFQPAVRRVDERLCLRCRGVGKVPGERLLGHARAESA